MNVVTDIQPFRRNELLTAFGIAIAVMAAIGTLLATAKYQPREKPEKPAAIRISMAPPPKNLPLLKLGGKRPNTVLPDLKPKPKPKKKRKQAAKPPPVEKQADTPPPPDAPKIVNDPDAGPPPDAAPEPDAEVAAAVDDSPDIDVDAGPTAATGPGAEDGVADGTETDPLKARAVNAYKHSIRKFFRRHFSVPNGAIPCEELKTLSANVEATVAEDRVVQSFTISGPSGNEVFDARVRKQMESKIGKKIPKPPPMYPQLARRQVPLTLTTKGQACKD